ncbi:MAG: hypothetical protein IKO22_02795 [Oscillospiraceae bacterium]|nr:hypothetical protein [Oscillospiraceae bacterium]
MTREEMLQIIREDLTRLGVPQEKIEESEKRINEFYDRKEAGQNSQNTSVPPPQMP